MAALPATLALLVTLTGCAASPPAAPSSTAATTSPGGVSVDTTNSPTLADGRGEHQPDAALTAHAALGMDAAEVCRRFAAAALTVGDATTTLGQARRAAARRFGTPRLQALYDGTGQGRDPQQELWRAHGARVTAQVQLVDDPHGHDTLYDAAQHHPIGQHERTQIDVLVTGVARAAAGWTAHVQPYQQSCLLLADPVRGWLVDDVHTESTSGTSATADGS